MPLYNLAGGRVSSWCKKAGLPYWWTNISK